MFNVKWTLVFVFILTFVWENEAFSRNNAQANKLVTQLPVEKLGVQDYMLSTVDKGKYKCTMAHVPHSEYNGVQPRFIDLGRNASVDGSEMEPPAPKFSFLNLITGDGVEDNTDDDDNETDEYDNGEKVNEEDESNNEDNNEEDIDFFGYDEEEEEDETKLKDEEDGDLKQYHRPGLRMHNLVFPLLLAYKLKFFTVIPLLLGSLVLLVGTTGIAGFFFALFAAALGIHVKSHNEHVY